jgi:hypothetical protein
LFYHAKYTHHDAAGTGKTPDAETANTRIASRNQFHESYWHHHHHDQHVLAHVLPHLILEIQTILYVQSNLLLGSQKEFLGDTLIFLCPFNFF